MNEDQKQTRLEKFLIIIVQVIFRFLAKISSHDSSIYLTITVSGFINSSQSMTEEKRMVLLATFAGLGFIGIRRLLCLFSAKDVPLRSAGEVLNHIT